MSLEDLRRMARVSREEGVAIRATRDMDGAFTIHFDPKSAKLNDSDDLDDRIASYGAS